MSFYPPYIDVGATTGTEDDGIVSDILAYYNTQYSKPRSGLKAYSSHPQCVPAFSLPATQQNSCILHIE